MPGPEADEDTSEQPLFLGDPADAPEARRLIIEDEEFTAVLEPEGAPGIVETLAELELRTARDGASGYVKDEGRFYVYSDGRWIPEAD